MLNILRVLIVLAVILAAQTLPAQEKKQFILPRDNTGAVLDKLTERINEIERRERNRDAKIESLAGDLASAIAGYLKMRMKLEIYRIVGNGLATGCPIAMGMVVAATILRKR